MLQIVARIYYQVIDDIGNVDAHPCKCLHLERIRRAKERPQMVEQDKRVYARSDGSFCICNCIAEATGIPVGDSALCPL